MCHFVTVGNDCMLSLGWGWEPVAVAVFGVCAWLSLRLCG